MKITLINPQATSFGGRNLAAMPQVLKQKFEQSPVYAQKLEFTQKSFGALGLLTIAGMIPDDIEVEYFDENMEPLNFGRDFDLVAITGNLDQMNRALAICDILRAKKVPMVAGGMAVTTFPELYARKGATVIVGEGELLFRQFLEDWRQQNVRNIYDQSLGLGYIDMQESPPPRFDLAAKYPYSFIGTQITRGCPYNCNYCQVTQVFGNKSRYKKMAQVTQEIKTIKSYWPDSFFFFYSDNPFANKTYTRELFDTLFHEENISLGRWGAMANVTIYKDPGLLKLLTEKGPISFLGIGFESLSEDTLGHINNTLKVNYRKEYETAIRVLKEHHVTPAGYFMFGFEQSKPQDLLDILDFVKKNAIYVEWSRLTPMPGTALYGHLKQKYEQEYGPMKKRNIAEWGILTQYLREKSGLSEDFILKCLVELYDVILADEGFVDIEVPFCPMF